jgi:hypothetical protein
MRSLGIFTAMVLVCAGAWVLQSKAADPKPQPSLSKPQVPEESATIKDDPTIAPDPKQSADNNVSFPTDI